MSSTTQSRIVVLQEGSIGAEVTDLQYILQARGFNPGIIDGEFGPKTTAAVRQYQRSKNLPVDGIVGELSWAAMGYAWAENQPGNFLRAGDSGNVVRQLQTGLRSKGLNPGALDGIFGDLTKATVIKFQKSISPQTTNVVGVVGPFIWSRFV